MRGNAERLDPDRLDTIFYWIARCKERGIYTYLDLLDYRTFLPAEGAVNGEQLGRGAKPAAVFDPTLIDLQIAYARELLAATRNPYTQLTLAEDPAVCLLELCDENGLFLHHKLLPGLPEPYARLLRELWNTWLSERHGSTAGLREAWTALDGTCPLSADESLEFGTVSLPRALTPMELMQYEETGERPYSIAQHNEFELFCYAVHCRYFRAMRQALREMGVEKPLTAVTDTDRLADLRSVAESLDFIGTNWHYDHPVFDEGAEWRLPAYFTNRNPITDDGYAAFVRRALVSRVHGKPLVLREWGVSWPNKFRGCGLMDAVAYAALHEIDGMILFSYDSRPERNRLDYFSVGRDPARWGLCGPAARIFLWAAPAEQETDDISPARHSVAIGYSETDSFWRDAGPSTPVRRLGWVSRLSTLFFDDVAPDVEDDLLIASGKTSAAAYPHTQTIICSNGAAGDLWNRTREITADMRSGYHVAATTHEELPFSFGGTMFAEGEQVMLAISPGFALEDILAQGLVPIGRGPQDEHAFGFFDPVRRNYVFRALPGDCALRVALDALGALAEDPRSAPSHKWVESRVFVSDTGELHRLCPSELLVIDAPCVQAFCGALAGGLVTAASQVRLASAQPLGVVLVTSLDGIPVARTDQLLITYTTVAANTEEEKVIDEERPSRANVKLKSIGHAPILTNGRPSDKAQIVFLGERRLVQAQITNGTWQLVRQGSRWYLWCDTPGAKFSLPDLGPRINLVVYSRDGQEEALGVEQPFPYPSDVLFVRLEATQAEERSA